MSTAGFIFKSNHPVNIDRLIRNLFASKVTKIEHPDRRDFDVRYRGNIMVQRFGGVYSICNTELVWDLLAIPDKSPFHLYESLGKPELFIAFCHFPSGGSFGYAYIKNGVKVRTRLFATTVPETNIDYGEHYPEEDEWINAKCELEEIEDEPKETWPKLYTKCNSPEEIAYGDDGLVQVMLDDVLKANFGIVPWMTDIEPDCIFYLTADAELKNSSTNKYRDIKKSWFSKFLSSFGNN